MAAAVHPGQLYLVGTPIGNLDDMTFRAVTVLQAVDLIAAEDTRHTGKLLQHFQIQTPQISYHEHNRQSRLPELLGLLKQGKAIALVTDAGMPGISDPGSELVQACAVEKISVVPIPGPTALATALCSSGLATERFVFEGFLPVKGASRQSRLSLLQQEGRTIVLYEAPHKLLKTLEDLAAALGESRHVALGRELTKRFEEIWRGTLAGALAHYRTQPPKGEFTLVIAGIVDRPVASDAAIIAELTQLIAAGLSRSQASRQLATTTGLSKKHIYQLSLRLETASQ